MFHGIHDARRRPSCLNICLFAICAICAVVGESRGQAAEEGGDARRWNTTGSGSELEPFDLRTTDRLTGEWGGHRLALEDLGVRFKIKFMNHAMVNMRGGRETKNGFDTAGSYEVDLYLDLEKLDLIKGGEFWIRGKGTWGGDTSDFDQEKIGAFFKTNQDASGEQPIFVDKWHYKQQLLDDKLELRIGRMEPTKDLFDRSKIIGHEDKYFLNRMLVRNATLPSNKGLGLFVQWRFSDHAYLSAGAFDAHARDRQTNFNTAFHDEDEFRYYGELGCKPELPGERGGVSGHYRIGAWFDPTTKTQFFNDFGGRLPARRDSGDWGAYFGFDQMVWRENETSEDNQGISVAGRYGWADGDANRIEHFWAAAIQYTGLIPTREKDTLAFGVGQGIFSDGFRWVRPRVDRETVFELYYSIAVTPWLTISPDFQYVVNAGGLKGDPHAMVAALRFKMSL